MDNAIIASVKQYAELSGYTEEFIFSEIKRGNESITNSVQMLMFVLVK